jgi:hypothetical protein
MNGFPSDATKKDFFNRLLSHRTEIGIQIGEEGVGLRYPAAQM